MSLALGPLAVIVASASIALAPAVHAAPAASTDRLVTLTAQLGVVNGADVFYTEQFRSLGDRNAAQVAKNIVQLSLR